MSAMDKLSKVGTALAMTGLGITTAVCSGQAIGQFVEVAKKIANRPAGQYIWGAIYPLFFIPSWVEPSAEKMKEFYVSTTLHARDGIMWATAAGITGFALYKLYRHCTAQPSWSTRTVRYLKT